MVAPALVAVVSLPSHFCALAPTYQELPSVTAGAFGRGLKVSLQAVMQNPQEQCWEVNVPQQLVCVSADPS
jgi:hypothetical protein